MIHLLTYWRDPETMWAQYIMLQIMIDCTYTTELIGNITLVKMSRTKIINDQEQADRTGIAANGAIYLKAAGSTDAGALVVHNDGSWTTFVNEYQPPPLVNNYSLEFDGADDGLLAGSSLTLSGSSAWTVSFWYRILATGSNDRTYSIFNSDSSLVPSTSGFRVQYRPANNDSVVTVYNNGVAYTSGGYDTLPEIPTVGWNHVAYTHDGSGTRKLYVNGVLRNTATGLTNDFLSAGNWIFGKSGTDPKYMRLDEIALIPSDLSTSMSNLYNGGVPTDLGSNGLDLDPTNWWRMEDGNGSTVTDYGSAENDAAIQNEASFSADVP